MDKKEFLELLKEACKEHLVLDVPYDGKRHLVTLLWKDGEFYEELASTYLPTVPVPDQNLVCSVRWDESSQNWK